MTSTSKMPSYGVPRAPISDRDRAMLRRRLDNLQRCAQKRGITLSMWEEGDERLAGDIYFEVGCWGYWAMRRRSKLTLDDRARAVFAMLAAGLTSPSYSFYTAFEWGEREYDTWFESGDGSELVQAISDLVLESNHERALPLLRKLGWERPLRQQSLFATAV